MNEETLRITRVESQVKVRLAPSVNGRENNPVKKATYAEVADRARSVRAILEERGIRLHQDSTLGKLLRDAENLVKDLDEGKKYDSTRRAIIAMHANRIAEAIIEVRADPAAYLCLERIAKKNVDLSLRLCSQGKDHLWELVLLSFCRNHGLSAKLVDPPDIIIDLAGVNHPVACKKVYSEKSVEAQMRKGVKQLSAQSFIGGIVAFNLDDLTPEDVILEGLTYNETSDFLAKLNAAFIERHRRLFEKYVKEGRCDGVLISTTVLAGLKLADTHFNTMTQTMLWTLSSANAGTRARMSALQMAFDGETDY
ncbi:hypothetical protein [Glaciimonas sp. PAMC28666]|uniref:hypothetical protein n=1 Tax=Glaciimonas sp. PAMC28666 TaxID=2807626 RepID=UPI0019627892|nr:hypothetical protein [Glaciimonas sp. PAMC28666]QRX82322.1 hypothetical protein JQN73_19890 [Glaciimonas sp. PAMC28666]